MSEFHFRYSYPFGALVSFLGGHLKYIYNFFNLNLNLDFPKLWFQWIHSWYCFSCCRSVTQSWTLCHPKDCYDLINFNVLLLFCKNSFTCLLGISPLPVASFFVALIKKSKGKADSVTCSTRGSLLSDGLLPWGRSM